jgi:hypothetical protein
VDVQESHVLEAGQFTDAVCQEWQEAGNVVLQRTDAPAAKLLMAASLRVGQAMFQYVLRLITTADRLSVMWIW